MAHLSVLPYTSETLPVRMRNNKAEMNNVDNESDTASEMTDYNSNTVFEMAYDNSDTVSEMADDDEDTLLKQVI
jgi:hypothetical protein